MFLLADKKNGKAINNFIGYTLGVSLDRNDQQLHAGLAMSNHLHNVLTDVLAKLPGFKNVFHSFLARGINAKRGRSEAFWSSDDACDVEQLTDEQTLKDIVYTYTNPVEAGLVKWAKHWAGFSTYGWKFGESRRFHRPNWFYDPDNPKLPDYVDITLVRPDIFPELSDDELYDLIYEKVHEAELKFQAEVAATKGGRFMGRSKLLKQRWDRRAKSKEERFTLTPTVASTCKWARIARLQRKEEWEREYADARDAELAGESPEFPYGTYWMRIFAGVRVAAVT